MYFFNIIFLSEKKKAHASKVSKVLEKKRQHQYVDNDYNILT